MSNEQAKHIREIQSVLISIDSGVPKFFNVAQYEKLGLITTKNKWGTDSTGNKTVIGYTYHLTPKAKQYIKVAV